MKILKLLFWFLVVVVMAYFLSDFTVKGKTIKEYIDDFLQNLSFNKAERTIKDFVNEKTDYDKNAPEEGITESDEKKLKEVLEGN